MVLAVIAARLLRPSGLRCIRTTAYRAQSLFTGGQRGPPQSRHIVIQTDGCLYRKSKWIQSDRAGVGVFFAPDHPDNLAIPVPVWQITPATTLADIKHKAVTLAVLLGSWQRQSAQQDDKITVLTDCVDLIQPMSLAYQEHGEWLCFKHVASDMISNADILAEKASLSSDVTGKLL